jgi:hypothetical protein
MDTRFISRIVMLMKPEKVWLPSERTLFSSQQSNTKTQLEEGEGGKEKLTNYPTPQA